MTQPKKGQTVQEEIVVEEETTTEEERVANTAKAVERENEFARKQQEEE